MGSLTPVNPKIYETQIFGGDYPISTQSLPTCDDPVLNSRLFCLIWFAAILDKGVNSLRD